MIEKKPGWKSHIEPIPKEVTEREWRDSELTRTDKLVILPDYPRNGTDLIAYRQALADYPEQEGFPNSDRPNQSDFTI